MEDIQIIIMSIPMYEMCIRDRFLGVWTWGLFFCVGEGGMNGGTNGQSASGAAAWSCLVRSFRRVILSV